MPTTNPAAAITELPDTIWTYDANGRRLYGRPNYAKPGVAEKVERDAFEAECAAHPVSGCLSQILRWQQIARFEARFAKAAE